MIADTGNDRVRRVGTDGAIRTIAGGGRRPSRDGASATSIRLSRPGAVRAAADGTILIAGDERLLRLGSDGTVDTIARTTADAQGLPSVARRLNTDGRALTASTLGGVSELDALPDGNVAAYVGGRLALLTRGGRADRLAVALPAHNRTLLLRGAVEIYATRPRQRTSSARTSSPRRRVRHRPPCARAQSRAAGHPARQPSGAASDQRP